MTKKNLELCNDFVRGGFRTVFKGSMTKKTWNYVILIKFSSLTINPEVMGGKPCIRGMRVTVGAVTGLLASGASFEEILELYPYLEEEDIKAALSYAIFFKDTEHTSNETTLNPALARKNPE
jgi:uncharacterized protein (DUF433 family)